MKILILEDDTSKLEKIKYITNSTCKEAEIVDCCCFLDFVKNINSDTFDLIILDLLVPSMKGTEERDLTEDIVLAIEESSKNNSSGKIAITKHIDKSDTNYTTLNNHNITIVTFSETNEDWQSALINKIKESKPPKNYDFVIVCALEKEAQSYEEINTVEIGETFIKNNLRCKELRFEELEGVVIICDKVGLVDTAITTTNAVHLFKPKLVGMSGICAGVDDSLNIYDLIVSEQVFQHDMGKSVDKGFCIDPSSISLNQLSKNHISKCIQNKEYYLDLDISNLRDSEYPDGIDEIKPKVSLGISASGNYVVANPNVIANIKDVYRKTSNLDMEVYSLYRACTLSGYNPNFFAIKAIVDHADKNKGDSYHRIGCELSAKMTINIISYLFKQDELCL